MDRSYDLFLHGNHINLHWWTEEKLELHLFHTLCRGYARIGNGLGNWHNYDRCGHTLQLVSHQHV